jgi:hypothetical protein
MSGGYPQTSVSTGRYYDGSPTSEDHHWSQNAESLGNITLINQQSFEGTWPPSGWSETGEWNKESDQRHHGSFSADFDGGYGRSGNLVTPNLDCSGAASIFVDFWYRDGGCESGKFTLQYYNGTSWNTIYDLGTDANNVWHNYKQEITDAQYLRSDFKVRWVCNTADYSDDAWVDLVTITKGMPIVESEGAGVMLTDADNQYLYVFDSASKRGALNVQNNFIEVNPVDSSLSPVSFVDSRDLIWTGAVVCFDGEPIYRSSDDVGLWVMVEHPPTVTVE